MGQRSKGRLTAPAPLADSGRPADLPSGGYNIAFRFGVEQAGKLRACDDLQHILANNDCGVHTPVKLVFWDHVSQMCHHFAADGRNWAMFNSDHEAANKQFPSTPHDQLSRYDAQFQVSGTASALARLCLARLMRSSIITSFTPRNGPIQPDVRHSAYLFLAISRHSSRVCSPPRGWLSSLASANCCASGLSRINKKRARLLPPSAFWALSLLGGTTSRPGSACRVGGKRHGLPSSLPTLPRIDLLSRSWGNS